MKKIKFNNEMDFKLSKKIYIACELLRLILIEIYKKGFKYRIEYLVNYNIVKRME